MEERTNYMWQNFVNAFLGLWTILAAYLYVPSGNGRVVLMVTGVVVAVLGFWGGAAEPSDDYSSRSMQH